MAEDKDLKRKEKSSERRRRVSEREQIEIIQKKAVLQDDQNNWLRKMAHEEPEEVYGEFGTYADGLDEDAVKENRDRYGDNKVTDHKKKTFAQRLGSAFINPFTIILMCLVLISIVTDVIFPLVRNAMSVSDLIAGTALTRDEGYELLKDSGEYEEWDVMTIIIVSVMVIISGILRFVQETRSGDAAERLLGMITTTCTVDRKGEQRVEIPLDELVVGDIVYLSNGDMVPADMRITEAKDLFISQSSMTGESEPVEKFARSAVTEHMDITDYHSIAFMGSNVVSGSGKGIVVTTGDRTIFGTMSASIAEEPVETSFTKGVNAVSWVLIRFMLIMVPIVFILNGLTNGVLYGGGASAWLDAFMYGMSVAVGLTPEMLPMIVTTCLAKGAVSMSKEKVVVKNLNSIQNFGAIDILCTDKTGTITQDKVVLEYHLDVNGKENSRVLRHAYLNSYFQTGYKNLMDLAVIKKTEEEEEDDPTLLDLSEAYTKIDEIPFDFVRRRLTTVVQDKDGKIQMVTKGAIEEMLAVCKYADDDGEIVPLSDYVKAKIFQRVDAMSEKGFRVLAVAQRTLTDYDASTFGVNYESEMVLMGYLGFLDPPKQTTADAIKALKRHGVVTKVLTGDNEKVTRTVCEQVGLNADNMLLGHEIEEMTDEELKMRVEGTDIFAKLTPDQKTRVVTALRDMGHVVGFMGDGINDAAAMKAADIGISVDTAVDVAKESADIILLEKDLTVLEKGIIEGRKTYANMIKYIKMTASSNFGNMFSVVAASLFLPGFQPMMSVHLIVLNLIYDISCITIPWDNVDADYLERPKKWDASSVGTFMLWIGPTSSIFDLTTYIFMYFVFCPMLMKQNYGEAYLYSELVDVMEGTTLRTAQLEYAGLFQAGWFIESLMTQSLVIHMIRTEKVPFIQSRASWQLTLGTFGAVAVGTAIPYILAGAYGTGMTTFDGLLGFVAPGGWFYLYLVPCILLYMVLATVFKNIYVRRYGELL